MGKRTVNPEGKSRAIMDAAAKQFSLLGFAGANTGDITKEAGCGAGTLFRLFNSKEALLNAVFQRAGERHAHFQDASFFDTDSKLTPREQFHRLFQAGTNMYETFPDDYMLFEMTVSASYLDEKSRQTLRTLRHRIVRWLQKLQEKGVLSDAPSEVIFSIVLGAVYRIFRDSRAGALTLSNSLLQSVEDTCWRGIAKEER
jgi:AcrR family transcriptional regulator